MSKVAVMKKKAQIAAVVQPRASRRTPTDVEVDQRIGQALKNARLARGITQARLGDLVGVSFQQIQKNEKGMNRISSCRLMTFARVLGTTPHALMGWEEEGEDDARDAFAENGRGLLELAKLAAPLAADDIGALRDLARHFAAK